MSAPTIQQGREGAVSDPGVDVFVTRKLAVGDPRLAAAWPCGCGKDTWTTDRPHEVYRCPQATKLKQEMTAARERFEAFTFGNYGPDWPFAYAEHRRLWEQYDQCTALWLLHYWPECKDLFQGVLERYVARGGVLPGQLSPSMRAFMQRVQQTEDGHWLWLGPICGKTPRFFTQRAHWSAARWIYEQTFGVRPAGNLRRACTMQYCVNPQHQTTRHGGQYEPGRVYGFCKRGHARIAKNTYVSPRGHATCRLCLPARKRERLEASAKPPQHRGAA